MPKSSPDRGFALVAALGALAVAVLARAQMAGWVSPYVWTVLEKLFAQARIDPFATLATPALGALPPAAVVAGLGAALGDALPWPWPAKLPAFVVEPLAAWAAFALVRLVEPAGRRAWLAAGAVLLAPSVLLNGALMGWNDVVWASFAMLCVLAVATGRSYVAAASLATGAALGTPALALAPFLAVAAARRQFAWPALGVALAILVAAMAVPVFAGDSIGEVVARAFGFFHGAPSMSGTAPGPDQFVTRLQPGFVIPAGVALAGIAMVALTRVALGDRTPLAPEALCLTAYVFIAVVAFLLPRATARFGFAADLLAIALAGINPAHLPLAIAQQIVSTLSGAAVAFNVVDAAPFAAVLNAALVPWAVARWWAALTPARAPAWCARADSALLVRAFVALASAYLLWLAAMRLAGGIGIDSGALWPARRTDWGGMTLCFLLAGAILRRLRRAEAAMRRRVDGAGRPGA